MELGFLHNRYLRGTAAAGLRGARPGASWPRIDALRPSIAFPGQVVPTR